MNKIAQIVLLFCLLCTNLLLAQVMLKPTTLEKQIEKSSLVVEGKVISKKSFWDVSYKSIYTVNTVEVYKVFKGQSIKTIEVITLGGSVGLKALVVTPSLKLQKGDTGVFILRNSDVVLRAKSKTKNKQFKPYGSLQGFYKYNLHKEIAVNPFNKKTRVSTLFYNEIMNLTKANYTEITEFNIGANKSKNAKSKTVLPPNSITFSPTTSTAGTKSVLTINGNGYGNTQGSVGFSEADDGGDTFVNALDTQVLSWTDTEIRVEIPSSAGTGQIQVMHSDNSFGLSAEELIITYAEINIESDDVPTENSGNYYMYQAQHVNDNGSGGYTWEIYTDFFNDTQFPGAKASFERAIETWRCASNINWIISDLPTSSDSTVGLEPDDINVVRFDNGSELDDDILGTCYSWYSGCATGGVNANWYVVEMDIVFDDATNWYFGTGSPGANQYDFQSVTTHELGHGHQLGHVINSNNDAMHFDISNGETLKILSDSNIEAANNVQNRSVNSQICSEATMSNYQCDSDGNNENLEEFISVFPVPAKQQFYIKNESNMQLDKIVIFDMRGRMISEYDISNLLNPVSINLIGKSRGVYFVEIYSGSEVVTKKVIIE